MKVEKGTKAKAGDKAAKVTKDKLKTKAEKAEKKPKEKAEKAEKAEKTKKPPKAPKVPVPGDSLDWPKGLTPSKWLGQVVTWYTVAVLPLISPGVAVTGCKDKTVKKIVRGDFKFTGENHGRWEPEVENW